MDNPLQDSSKFGPVYFSASIDSCDFKVVFDPNIPWIRYIDLFLNGTAPGQVGLGFGDFQEPIVNSANSTFVQIFLPIDMLGDILYLLSNWKQKNVEVAFDSQSKKLIHLNLSSVNKP